MAAWWLLESPRRPAGVASLKPEEGTVACGLLPGSHSPVPRRSEKGGTRQRPPVLSWVPSRTAPAASLPVVLAQSWPRLRNGEARQETQSPEPALWSEP